MLSRRSVALNLQLTGPVRHSRTGLFIAQPRWAGSIDLQLPVSLIRERLHGLSFSSLFATPMVEFRAFVNLGNTALHRALLIIWGCHWASRQSRLVAQT
jgi:hypothetical protein